MRVVRRRNTGNGLVLIALACGLALAVLLPKAFAQKHKKDETQTLQLPRELPATVEADPRRLTFQVTPLSSKGLLSRQVRDALSVLSRQAKGDPILQIRAFVAGSGDARRVRDLVSEVFTERKQPLPVLALVQAGGLPLEGAQVVMEAVAAGKKEVNQYGLAFLSAQAAAAADPTGPVAPLVVRSLDRLRLAVKAAGSEPADVVRISCFLSSLDDLEATRKVVAAEYPGAAADYVQTQRAPARGLAACEAIAKLRWNTGTRLNLVNPEGLEAEPGESQIALVASPKVVLTGTQVSFGFEEKDARLAFERVEKALEQAGVSSRNVAFAHFYPLAAGIAGQVRQVRGEFFDGDRPPGSSLLLFEGLPSMNAGFAMDVVAVK
jgi:enamine deaminase RidA (YjgF/YER057c/UK114 family)